MKRLVACLALVPLLGAPAFAADYPLPPAPLPPPPPPVDVLSGAYLRADIGYTFSGDLDLHRPGAAPLIEDYFSSSTDRSWSVGGGVGYRFNAYFRMDATLEYRFKNTISGVYSPAMDPAIDRDDTRANLSSTVGLINAYLDLGNWSGFTPYIGAGLGGSRLSLGDSSGFTTITPASPLWGVGYCPAVGVGVTEACVSRGATGSKSSLNLAWALMAGAAINVGPGLQIDVGYRYLNQGDVTSRLDIFGSALQARNVDSHELRVGLRYSLGQVPAPVYAKN